jgi:hypothetical protein
MFNELMPDAARVWQTVGEQQRRFAPVQRGSRLTRAGTMVGRTRLRNVDGTVPREIEGSQAVMTAAEEALDELTSTPARIQDRLGQASFGAATRPTAAAVPARLRSRHIT